MSSIKEAKDFFFNSSIDILVIGNKIYSKWRLQNYFLQL
jgi:hypothetical protein